MRAVRVFDSAMRCSTAVCGPSVDPQLARFAADLDWLKAQGVSVGRFDLAQQPAARADLVPVAWVFDQSLTPFDVTDSVLVARRRYKAVHLRELASHARRSALEAWHADVMAADPGHA